MGASVGNNNSGLNNEPNVVPMIDIMLVLLIIFMVVQSMNRKAVDLQLQEPTPSVTTANPTSNQIVLEVLADGSYAVNREPLTKQNLAKRLTEIYEGRPDKIIFVKGDPKVRYQDVIFAMDEARGAGVKVIGIPPKDTN
jgi:biopolymer transport protein ExbD